MSASPVIDVSKLPESVLDHRSPVWWGNLVLVIIETTLFALLVACYFYIRPNFETWPPTRADGPAGDFRPVPALFWPTLNLVLIAVSFAPMLWADRAALKRRCPQTEIALAICVLLGLAIIAVRFQEFGALKFRWDDNAYASVVWTIVGLHLLHLIIGTIENALMLTWLLIKGLDDKHARDVRVSAVYWYWIVGTWIVLYAILLLGPRLG